MTPEHLEKVHELMASLTALGVDPLPDVVSFAAHCLLVVVVPYHSLRCGASGASGAQARFEKVHVAAAWGVVQRVRLRLAGNVHGSALPERSRRRPYQLRHSSSSFHSVA